MTALLTLMWKKANSNTMGKRSMPSVDIMKMKDFQRLMQEEHLEEVMRSQMTGGNE